MNPTEWQLYSTSKQAWEGMLEACRNAKHTIEFEQFYFTADTIGREFIDVLIYKAKEGIKIRCIFDSMGSFYLAQSSYPDIFEHVGIEIRFFNWLFPYSAGNKRSLYFRDHRRNLITDNSIGFTGGVCISDKMKSWRDTHVKIQGPVVQQMLESFEHAWDRAHKKSTRFSQESRMDADGFTYSTHAPLPRQRYLYYRLIEAIRQSHRSIYLTTPYFLPDRRLLRVLILAKKRGVDVQVLIPNISNHPLVDTASHTYFNQLLKVGIKLFQYNAMIHSKTAVIDSDWAMLGSMNLDNISLRYNFESAIVSVNKKFTADLEEQFHKDLLDASELTHEEWQNRSFLQKVAEFFVWPIRKLL